tara:strand:- start:87 stop:785 length:699 start_codon:yes stop_codon:yes gene_type:complete
MAVSLNEMVGILSDRVGKPFSIPLQRELKVIMTYKRVAFMKRSLEKNPSQRRFYTQSFVVKLTEVDDYAAIEAACAAQNYSPGNECKFMETNCEVPQPIRSSTILFDYVGTPNFRDGYAPAAPDFAEVMSHNKYTGTRPKWSYYDKKIKIYNNFNLKFIGVRGVFEYPEDINKCNCADSAPSLCYDDDQPFPAPQDLINDIMRDTLSVELRNMFPDMVGEVEMDKEEPITKR